MTENSPKRRWFQFSLRMLFVAVMALSLPLSWLAVRIERVRKQKDLVERIELEWGLVVFDWEDGVATTPPYPPWLRTLLGDHFFCNVSAVILYPREFGDEEATCLKELKNLKRLELGYTNITDAGLEHIEKLSNLEVLRLNGTKISDAGLEHVENFKNLVLLQLDYTGISDAGLEHLSELPNLDTLLIDHTNVTPNGLKRLQKALPNCKIYCTPIPVLVQPYPSVVNQDDNHEQRW